MELTLEAIKESLTAIQADIREIRAGMTSLQGQFSSFQTQVHNEISGLRDQLQSLTWRVTGIVSGMAVAVILTVVGAIASNAI